jgi:hypothetical protein
MQRTLKTQKEDKHPNLKSGQKSWPDNLLTEEIKMADEYMKRCLASLVIWGIKIKATMKYYHISVITAKIQDWTC